MNTWNSIFVWLICPCNIVTMKSYRLIKIILLLGYLMSDFPAICQNSEVSCPFVNVARYHFMEEIANYIKATDKDSTFPPAEMSDCDSVFMLEINDVNPFSKESVAFESNGTYTIQVSSQPYGDHQSYNMFSVNGVTFASSMDLYPFFQSCEIKKRSYPPKFFLWNLFFGGGHYWTFIVSKGIVTLAVFHCEQDSIRREDLRWYDLKHQRQISVKDYENLSGRQFD